MGQFVVRRAQWTHLVALIVGNWRVNQVPHPGGLRPVADAAHAAGMRFLLWVEMERVFHDTPIVREHPEWLLADGPNPSSYLLNLGVEGACQWAIDTVERLVREDGVDDYREDFNFNTIPYWEKADTPDRVGVTEMKFIAGLYRFWDTIRARHPDMLIDNCASGGRRIDLETISRSICLYRSDMLGRPWYDASGANQTHIASLTQWVPLHAGGTTVVNGDDYGFLSGVSSGVDTTIADGRSSTDLVWLRELLAVSRRMGDFFCRGDLHVLTPDPASRRDFFAYQLHSPESGEGFFIVFRRPEGDEEERVLHLRQIDASARYRLEPFRGEPSETTGATLARYRVALPEPRSVFLCFYRAIRD